MKKINFCKATTIILIINVILSIVLFFVVPDNIAIQWAGTSPRNAVDSYYRNSLRNYPLLCALNCCYINGFEDS